MKLCISKETAKNYKSPLLAAVGNDFFNDDCLLHAQCLSNIFASSAAASSAAAAYMKELLYTKKRLCREVYL